MFEVNTHTSILHLPTEAMHFDVRIVLVQNALTNFSFTQTQSY